MLPDANKNEEQTSVHLLKLKQTALFQLLRTIENISNSINNENQNLLNEQ